MSSFFLKKKATSSRLHIASFYIEDDGINQMAYTNKSTKRYYPRFTNKLESSKRNTIENSK